MDVSVRARRRIAATNALDPTASGTSLDVLERVSTPLSLGDVVRESAGARVLSTGGLGAFASLSLRGAQSDETLVMLDEIPLSTADGGAFDLSVFPAQLFSKVNVYRGGAPAWLGAGAIGGVVQLIPRRGDFNGINASATAGSYGTYIASAGSDVSTSRGYESHTQLVLRDARNDFPYVDDRGTAFDRSDDREFKLKNGDFHDASGYHDFSLPLGPGRLHVVALGVVRGGGLSGPAAQPTPKVRHEGVRALTAASYSLEGGDTLQRNLQLVAAGSFGAERFNDLEGQLGLSRRTSSDNRTFRLFLRSAGSQELTKWLRADLIGLYAFDVYLPHDRYVRPDPNTSHRHTASGTAELIAHGALGKMRWEVRPSVRLEWSNTASYFVRPQGPTSFDKTVLVPTGRVGAVLEVLPGVALSSSFATGTRLPTIFELFGDGGLTLASPGLRPVKSTSYDGGLTAKGKVGILSGSAELRGFWQERQDSIALIRTAQYQVAYENLSRVHVYGVESRLSGEITRWFRPSGAFTWMETETALQTRLPFRPKFVAFARPELYVPIDWGWLSSAAVSTEVWHRSYSFYDDKNLTYSPSCTKLGFGAGLSMFHDAVKVSARMDDALDQRCMDLIGYPLSGRMVFFSLSYREVGS
ncbi:MAG TPA: TonB-dependent receptor [Polyangiales bacterium]|nr:TonB-dependent receptor [Polyangiales bacterium]